MGWPRSRQVVAYQGTCAGQERYACTATSNTNWAPFTNGVEGGGQGQAGRDHNPYGFSVWMAGGGIQGGKVIGATNEIGLRAVEDKVHMHDLHATMLTLLGLDYRKLTYHFQGRDFRLTDVGGQNNLAPRLTQG